MNNIDFNFIIYSGVKEGLSVNGTLQLALLCGLTKGVTIKLDTETLKSLIDEGYIDGLSKPTPKGLRVFKRLKIDNSTLARTLREMYPAGFKDDRWPWRGSLSSVTERLDDFNKMYPDISDEEIIETTKDYLNKFVEDGGRSLLVYFIWKQVDGNKRSILADWVYAKREGKETKIKSNTDQL